MLIMCCICSIHAFENKIQHQAQSHGTDDEHCDLQQCDTAKTSQIITAALVRGTAFNLTLNGKKPIWISLLALSRYITDALLNKITNTEKQKGDHVKML